MPEHRIRVLRLIARMNVGGPAVQVTALVRGLDPERFEQRLMTGATDDGERDYCQLRGADVSARFVPGLGRAPRPLDDVRALASIHRAIREFRPHIVHTHTAKAGALGRMAAGVAGVPAVVHSFHGHVLYGYFSSALTRAVVLSERALARRTTRFVAVGARVRDELLTAGIGRSEQYRVVPPGVDLAPAPDRAAARRELGLPLDDPVIAFIGRLTAIKRPDRLIDVLTEINGSGREAVLAIAGEGNLIEDVRRRATPLGERVRFLGWRSDVETVLAAADLVLLTSDNEGMPVSLIEAAMAGRPAVATDVGSAAEVIEHGVTGLLTATDVQAVAGAVRLLLDDEPLRQRMGMAARARARCLFGTDRLVAEMAHVYEEIADQKGFG